jgi:hypothetical protein
MAGSAAACLSVAFVHVAAANGEKPAMSDAKSAFAKAVGATPQAISAFLAVPLPSGGAADALWVGTSSTDDRMRTWAMAGCKGSPCAGKPASMPTASSLALAALADLQGAAFKLDLKQLPKDPAGAQPLPKQPGKPAALVLARHKLDSGELRDTLVLLSASDKVEVLWRETASSTPASGGGFQSLELGFVRAAAEPWLELTLLQHSLPAKGDPAYRPGPPLTLRFAYRQGAYHRVR